MKHFRPYIYYGLNARSIENTIEFDCPIKTTRGEELLNSYSYKSYFLGSEYIITWREIVYINNVSEWRDK